MKQSAGYCRLKHIALSVERIREKGCIDPRKQHGSKTQCRYLRKHLDHPHWVRKAILKEFRRAALI